MKKIALLALAAAAFCGSSAMAQEVQYVEDCSQGQIFNRAKDNWFLTVQGGANVLFSKHDKETPEFKNRIGANAGIYLGKWINPSFGFRFGASWDLSKGATTLDGRYAFHRPYAVPFEEGSQYCEERFMGVGPEFDIMINLTNWWCGYRPGRVFNAVVVGGAGAYWTSYRGNDSKGNGEIHWRFAHNTMMFANLGLQLNFRVAKHVELFLMPKAELIDFTDATLTASLNAGITFKFGQTEWFCPTVAICPTWKYTDAEGDALVESLSAANNRIADLQNQLKECNSKINSRDVEFKSNFVTVYYPINDATLSAREKKVLQGAAAYMIASGEQYELVGYADSFTGTEEVNDRIRNARVDGVKNYLVSLGVDENKLQVNTNPSDLVKSTDAATAPLDRAVTIREK